MSNTYIDGKLNHIESCHGNLVCIKCGRRGCKGCIRQDSESNRREHAESIGQCVVCSGTWKPEKILLYDIPDKNWDFENNI